MKNYAQSPWQALCGLLIFALVVSVPAVAEPPLAVTQHGGTVVSWEPRITYDHVVLHVRGPAGDFTQTFSEGEVPHFDLATLEGPADGSYSFELTFSPRLLPEVHRMMEAIRQENGDSAAFERQLREQGHLPSQPLIQTGHLRVLSGQFLVPTGEEPAAATLQPRTPGDAGLSSASDESLRNVSAADQFIPDDLIVVGSACIGQDCVNNESFGFDTIRLKENNLRIKFDDTSNSGSFPFVDWQLTANENQNGGANKFSIEDITNSRIPFTIEANAPNNALYVDSNNGHVGLSKTNPAVELHIVDGDSPTIRLEQDGSSGFTAQTWDLAGNEANFFVRDVTNGSQLPFRIIPGADTGSLVITGDNDILIQGSSTATSADAALHVRRTNGTAKILVEETQALETARTLMQLTSAGPPRLFFSNSADDLGWELRTTSANVLRISDTDAAGNADGNTEFDLNAAGDLTISGDFFSATCGTGTPCAPDYVFEPDYNLMPIAELASFIQREKHLPNVPSAKELTGPINISKLQMTLLEKIEELTLYTLEQHQTLEQLSARLAELEEKNSSEETEEAN